KKPVFLSFSIHKSILSENSKNLYPVGALAQLSNTEIDNLPLLEAFYSNPKFLDELNNPANEKDAFRKVLANLYPGLGILKSEIPLEKARKLLPVEERLKKITDKSL